MRSRSAAVTFAGANSSNRSGGRCSASPTRKAASATGSMVPWANTSFAAFGSRHRIAHEIEHGDEFGGIGRTASTPAFAAGE